MEAKIHIKLGLLEVEYEGDSSFLDGSLIATVEKILDLQSQHKTSLPPLLQVNGGEVANQHPSKVGNNLSTHTIAGLLKATTCPDLVIAAAAYLKFSQGQETFTRGEIQSQMKSASPYYKRSFSGGNLTRAFDTLTKADRLRLASDNKYSFSAKEISALESRLAES